MNQAASALFWTLLVLLALSVAMAGPVLTSDGPGHVSMAHYMVHAGDPAWPMLNRLYEFNPVPSPNALGDYFLAGLMLIVSPLAAEQVTQSLCLVSIPLAAWLTLRRLAPDAGWIALFFFPVAMERMFFLGLYNYCLSVAGCILCIWAWLRLRERASLGRGLTLTVLLLLTFACQASGWMEAALAVGTMVLAEAWPRRDSPKPKMRLPVIALFCVTPGAGLLMLFALFRPGDSHVTYGPPPLGRLIGVLRGDPFAPIGQSTALVSLILGITLLAMALCGLSRSADEKTRRPRLAMFLVPVSFLAFLLVVPDEAGGGWTHTWRAEVFPYIGLALACATVSVHRLLKTFAICAATLGSLVMIVMLLWVQLKDVPAATHEFDEAAAVIGPHCTLAPVLTQFKLEPENSARLFYHPLFHYANRFELRDDRPVLFSYLARLPIYAVRFRPAADPQHYLFGWLPSQRDTHVYKIDIAGFEAASGIPVDYVLLWDFPEPEQPGPHHDLRLSLLSASYRPVLRTSGGRGELFQRPGPGGCGKR